MIHELTVFSFGAGQESTTLLYKIINDSKFREKHFPGRLLVVGSDTGDEHSHTYENVKRCKNLCLANNIEFHWLTPDMGFHGRTWQTLTHQYKLNRTIGSAAYRQTCTDNLKVKVIDRFLEHWLLNNYYPNEAWKNKKVFHQFLTDHGKIRLVLGFAKGEEGRTSNGNKFDAIWKQRSVVRYYPLIEDGLDRQSCINYNVEYAGYLVWPSNCMRCFYQSDIELIWLFRNHSDIFWEWVEMERQKLLKNVGVEKNFGVYGQKTLVQKVELALIKYAHMTDAEIDDYKFSHGHCIKSKY